MKLAERELLIAEARWMTIIALLADPRELLPGLVWPIFRSLIEPDVPEP